MKQPYTPYGLSTRIFKDNVIEQSNMGELNFMYHKLIDEKFALLEAAEMLTEQIIKIDIERNFRTKL